MGLHQPPKYRKYNKETKTWEWYIPPPVDLAIEKSYMKRVEVRGDKENKKKKKP